MNESSGNIFHKLTDKLFKKHKRSLAHQDPLGDWQRIVLTFMVVMFLVTAAASWVFYKLNRGELFSTETTRVPEPDVFNRTFLQQDNDFYNAREARFNSLKTASTTVIDPSR